MISLEIKGTQYVDFTSASVSISLEEFARSFSFNFSDKWLRTFVQDLPFVEGDPCRVFIDGEPVIDGFIDSIPIAYDASSHSIEVAGRSWTGHLVDCSAIYLGGSWKSANMNQIGANLCAEYGIAFLAVDPGVQQAATQPFKTWAIESEETVYECLQRLAQAGGVFLISDQFRSVVVTTASKIVFGDTLRLGDNILSAQRTSRFTDRYSFYIVKSQSAGDDSNYGDLTVKGLFYRTEDPQVTSFRPLVVTAEGPDNAAALELRGKWERNIRAGRSRRVTYTVQGHRARNKQLWPINQLVAVDDPFLETRDNLLLVSTVFSQDAQRGSTTTLELGRPEAFDVLAKPPLPKKKKRALY